jgi:hypothetical protein
LSLLLRLPGLPSATLKWYAFNLFLLLHHLTLMNN